MTKITKAAIFWRVFLVSLIVGVPAGSKKALADDASDWARASQSGTRDALIWYMRRHPDGRYVDQAIKMWSDLDSGADGSATRQISVY